jgi:putative glutamine amidotransferase
MVLRMAVVGEPGEGRRRARIGICASIEQARYGVWDSEVLLVPRLYVAAVQRAGGLAVILTPDPATVANPDEVLDALDGLILAGGVDMDPGSYGAERHPTVTRTVPERDAFEMALARRALERDLPLLGICRGMQVLNVACGGTLIQHLPDDVGHEDHRRTPGSFDDADHDVRLEADSIAARAAGETLHGTKSHHHQGIDRLGEGLRVTGWATLDDLPEAIEAPDRLFALGVQWHPEADPASSVVAAFVATAQGRLEPAPA